MLLADRRPAFLRETLPVSYLSASSINRAVSCPEQWRRKYVLGEAEKVSVERFMGSVDHKTIEGALLWRMELGRIMDSETFASAHRGVWSDLETDEQPKFDSFEEKEKLQEISWLMAQRYYEDYVPSLEPIGVEQRFEETIPGMPLPVMGYLDVELSDRVIERKTEGKRATQLKPTWRLQGALYGLVTAKPIEWHVTTRQKTPQIVTGLTEPGLRLERVSPDLTASVVTQVYGMLRYFMERYGPFEPWPLLGLQHEWRCNYCTYGPRGNSDCPGWKQP